MRSSIKAFTQASFVVLLSASVFVGVIVEPFPASARPLANSIEFGVQPGFAVWGEDHQRRVEDEYSTDVRIGYFITDDHEFTFSMDFSNTKTCIINSSCSSSDYSVYMLSYAYNYNRWKNVVPYVETGLGYFNLTGQANDDGTALSLGSGVRWFPTRWPVYLGLDLRFVGLFGRDNVTANGIFGFSLGATYDLKLLFGN